MSSSSQFKSPDRAVSKLRPVWIHSLLPGTHPGQNGAVTITPEHIQQIANSYSPELHEAPAVIGHPSTDAPAYGWVRAAEAREDGLWLNTDLLPEMADMVEQQLYKKRSVSLYPPHSLENPKPGVYYLKHVGFLGAQPPAVKGLKPLALNEEPEETIVINFSKESPMCTTAIAAGASAEDKSTAAAPATVALSETDLTAREQELQRREKALRRRELESKLEPIIQAGKLLPVQKPLALALCERIDGEAISFSEGEAAKPLLDEFIGLLGKFPAQVNLNEVTPPVTPVVPGSTTPVNFAAPSGFTVSAEGLEMEGKVQAWLKKNPSKTYVEAVAAVQRGE